MMGVYNVVDNVIVEVILQFFFFDEFNVEIFGGYEDYFFFGQFDIQFGNDNVVGGEDDLLFYVLDIQKMFDGVMFVSKMIIFQSFSVDFCTM